VGVPRAVAHDRAVVAQHRDEARGEEVPDEDRAAGGARVDVALAGGVRGAGVGVWVGDG